MVGNNEFQIGKNQIQNNNLLNIPNEQISEYIIELSFNNKIYYKSDKNQTISSQGKEFIENEIVTINLPTLEQIHSGNNNISNNDYYIKVIDLIINLKMKGYPITQNSKLFIRLKFFDDYVLIANQNDIIYTSMLPSKNKINLKIKNIFEKSIIKDTFTILKNNFLKETEEKERPKSQKLKIGEVVKLVYQYRILSDGYFNEQKKFVKYTLEEAAKIIDMPKSTLDNYYDQIKKAREKNFDFNKNKDEPYFFMCVYNRIKKD